MSEVMILSAGQGMPRVLVHSGMPSVFSASVEKDSIDAADSTLCDNAGDLEGANEADAGVGTLIGCDGGE